MSSNRMQAEMDKMNAGLAARPLSVFFKHPNKFVSTMLVGNNITLVIYGILFAKLFDSTIFAGIAAENPALAVALDTILSTVVVLFTGEFLPKMLFKSQANRLLMFFALPAFLCYIILYPISSFSTFLSNTIMRIFGMKVNKDTENEEFSKLDLDYLVQESLEKADDQSRTLSFFQNALELSDIKVRDCMVPRTEICAIQNISSLEELKVKFVETGKSKIIVFKEDIDHIIGYIHSSEMFKKPKQWTSKIIPIPFVPETMALQCAHNAFRPRNNACP